MKMPRNHSAKSGELFGVDDEHYIAADLMDTDSATCRYLHHNDAYPVYIALTMSPPDQTDR